MRISGRSLALLRHHCRIIFQFVLHSARKESRRPLFERRLETLEELIDIMVGSLVEESALPINGRGLREVLASQTLIFVGDSLWYI